MKETLTPRLVMAGNSIGNPKDIPTRSLEFVRTAHLLVFEEHKIARQILKAAGVTRNYLQFSEHNEKGTVEEVADALKLGKTVLYMSDQGMPNFADPGAVLLKLAYKEKAKVEVIPGPSAFSAAIAACPFDCQKFLFYGFLPREKSQRQEVLSSFKILPYPVMVFDTPYRLTALIDDAKAVFGNSGLGFLAVDIGGNDEYYEEGSFSTLQKYASALKAKTNFVFIIKGPAA